VKFERTDSFKTDYQRLTNSQKELLRGAVRAMSSAFESRTQGQAPAWPRRLRIRTMAGVRGVFEMSWSFAGPDGRATFEFVSIEGEKGIRWRRVGGHAICGEP
jgi:hypothetical protein